MNDRNNHNGKRPAGADLIIPLLAAAFAVYYMSTIWHLPWEAKANGLVLGSVLLFLVALFFVLTARSLLRGAISLSLSRLFEPRQFQTQRWGLVVLMIGFIAVIPYFGFTLTIFLFLVLAMLVLGVRSWRKLIGVALGSALCGYLMFIVILDTPFPHGPLEVLLGRLF
ncbi:MAG TPA: tripartite tricarboxylate transporter TctB family protein [Burkholderiales bacterium]|jgi:signal transduction histidine kinase|nr:tripartite tricarboxylate transporter TctB family protein [Burkholderiales bacterium]